MRREMDRITIKVADKETINLMCMKCGNSRQISVASLISKDNRYRIQCRCGYSYTIVLERRRSHRKKTDLRGSYIADKSTREERVDIIDLSTLGLCLVRRDNTYLKNGQIINLSFVLENTERDEVKCKATIRRVNDDKVGVEFLDLSPSMQKILAFYLFNYVNRDTGIQEINFPVFQQSESAG